MYLSKLSKSFLYAISGILKLYTYSLIENYVMAFHIILIYYYNTFTKIKHSLINRLP